MYAKITAENPYQTPMRIYPAVHYTMGGLWVDYNLMSNLPGLHVLGEANFSDHGANRLGASALMQGLADGYFIIPHTLGHYLVTQAPSAATTDHPAFAEAESRVTERISKLLGVGGKTPAIDFHRRLGKIMWDHCGMARSDAGLKKALIEIPQLREEFWSNVRVTGTSGDMNIDLEEALRIADFLEFGETLALDALTRAESCGGHFREESQTPEGEALRNDENYCHTAAWEWKGTDQAPVLHKEELSFENVHLAQRSYK
jgi:succinate dehydrogenase / fumarate reductase flavoprotein subunit